MVKENKITEEDFSSLPIVGHQPEGEKEESYLREIGQYEFFNLEDNGLRIRFPYGSTNHHRKFTFFHGGKYKIPRHVAHHIETRSTPIHEYRTSGNGRLIGEQIGTKPRFQMRQVYGT